MLIPVSDEKRLREVGCPFTKKTLYKFRSQGLYPGLTVKIGGKLCLNLEVMQRMIDEDIKRQMERAKRIKGE